MAMLLTFEETDVLPFIPQEDSFEALQEAVGGYVEVINCYDSKGFTFGFMIIDEEGKIKNKPVNPLATKFARQCNAIFPHDVIAGDAVFITTEEAPQFGLAE